jgi:hypothetical protein
MYIVHTSMDILRSMLHRREFFLETFLIIEKGRMTSKSPHLTFGYFLSISQQDVSADIIQNSAIGNFSSTREETKTKAARCLFFLMSFPFM